MRDDGTITGRVITVLTERLGIPPDTVTATADLVEDLGIDSVDAVEFVLTIEREFEVSLPDGLLAEVRTVQQVVDVLCGRAAPLAAAVHG